MDRIAALQKEHSLTLPEEFPFQYAKAALEASVRREGPTAGAGGRQRVQSQTRERLPFEPEMVEIPDGSFRMGCVSGRDCFDDEHPVHPVHPVRTQKTRRKRDCPLLSSPSPEPQQEHHHEPEQQQRVPGRPYARKPEPESLRGGRESPRASRDGHDEDRDGAPLAPQQWGRGAAQSGPSAVRRWNLRLSGCETVAGRRLPMSLHLGSLVPDRDEAFCIR